jgi:type IV pilus assembly protein PilF
MQHERAPSLFFPVKRRIASLRAPILSILISLLAVSGCSTGPKKSQEAEFRLRLGTSYLASADYPRAMGELLRAEALDPKNHLIQNNLGLVYFFDEHYTESLQHLSRAIALNPHFNEARNNRGRVLIEMERYDEAIADLKIVIADLTYLEPAKALVNLGIAYFRKKDYPAAKEKFSQALQLDRNNCLAITYYGRCLFESSKYNEAVQALDNAVVICKAVKFDEPHYYSGLGYFKLGKTSAAVARMEEVIQMFPHSKYAEKAESMLKIMK